MNVTKESVDANNKSIDEAEKVIKNTINALEKEIKQTEIWMKQAMMDMDFNLRHGNISDLSINNSTLRRLEARHKALKDALTTVKVLGNLKFARVKPEEVNVDYGTGFTPTIL